jgi:hypothetical protein
VRTTIPTSAKPDPIAQLNERIDSVLDRLAGSTVFAPDSSLVLGAREAVSEVEALCDEFVGAVFSLLPRGVALPDKPVTIERDWFAAIERWSSAWRTQGDSLVLDALCRAAFESRAEFAQVLPRGDRERIDGALAVANSAIERRSPALSGGWITGVAPSVVAAARHIEWMCAGREERSPWSIALSLYERGVWPMLMPDGAVLAWFSHEPLRGWATDEWIERRRYALEALRDAELRWSLAMAQCAVAGVGALTLSEAREAMTLEVQRPELATEAIDLGSLVRVGRAAGSDLCVKTGLISRSHFTLYYVNDWVLLSVDRAATAGVWIDEERVTLRRFDATQQGRWSVGGVVFRLVATKGRAATTGLVHVAQCGYSKSYSERTRRAGAEESALKFQGQTVLRALKSHPRAERIQGQIERWTAGPRFVVPLGANDDEQAQRLCEARARALFAAVHEVAPIVPSAPRRVHVERSLVRACAKVQRAWESAAESRIDPRRMRMAFALEQLPHEDGRGAKSLSPSIGDSQSRPLHAGLDRTQSGAVLLFTSALQRASAGWSRDVLPFAQRFAWVDPDVAASLARKAVRWEAACFDATVVNPWEAMFDCWLSGMLLWHLPDDEVLVCLPFSDPSGALDVNPAGEDPPTLAQSNFVASTLYGVGELVVSLARKALELHVRGDRWRRGSGRVPDAQLVYREGWLWARDVRWELQSVTVLGTDGSLVDDKLASPRRSFRIVAEEGVHWVLAPETPSTRETLRVNGRTVRGRPLVHGDLVELERDGNMLFSGRYECAEQRAGCRR